MLPSSRPHLLGLCHCLGVVLRVQVGVVDDGGAVAHGAAPAVGTLLAEGVPRPFEIIPLVDVVGDLYPMVSEAARGAVHVARPAVRQRTRRLLSGAYGDLRLAERTRDKRRVGEAA